MNIETNQETLDELLSAFRFNDAVLRHMSLVCKEAITEPSPMMKALEKERERESRETTPRATAPSDEESSSESEDTASSDPAAEAEPAETVAEES